MKLNTISARVDVHTRRLAEAAADLCGASLSAFAAAAIERQARRDLLGGQPLETGEGSQGMRTGEGEAE